MTTQQDVIDKLLARVRRLNRDKAILKQQVKFEEQHNESTRQWALKAFEEQRRLSKRCEFLYGVARAHGATAEELRGE